MGTNVHTARLICLLVEVNVQIAPAHAKRRATTEDPAMIGLVNSGSFLYLSVFYEMLSLFFFLRETESLCWR